MGAICKDFAYLQTYPNVPQHENMTDSTDTAQLDSFRNAALRIADENFVNGLIM